MERATELLVRSIHETDAPIADIGDALARMAAAQAREGTVELF